MEIVLYVFAGILVLVGILGIIAPNKYEVNRSIVFNKPIDDTFSFLRNIKNQNHWSPWKKKDPNMHQEFSGTDGEVGFVSKWKGNKEVGEGEQEIINIVENETIDSELRFFKPWKSTSIGHLVVDKVDTDQTLVTWGFSGNNPFPFNIMMLFFSFEKAVGKDFEEGLNNLKKHLEN